MYLGQKSGQNTVKEWSEHKKTAIYELSTLENLYTDSFFDIFIFVAICLSGGQLTTCHESWVVISGNTLLCNGLTYMYLGRRGIESIGEWFLVLVSVRLCQAAPIKFHDLVSQSQAMDYDFG